MKEIIIKRQQIEDENSKIRHLKSLYDNKNKYLLNIQKIIEEKQLQLKVCVFNNIKF